MKITRRQLKQMVIEEIYMSSLLSEGIDVDAGVSVKGNHKITGNVRAKKKGKKGVWYLVHWGGTMADKIPEKDHITNPEAMDWLDDAEIANGWTMATLKSIVNKYPEKGAFTWQQEDDLDDQEDTGKTARGWSGVNTSAQDLEIWADTLGSSIAFVADFFPGPGTAISATIATSQAIRAAVRTDWLAAGLSLIAVIPVIGDTWKTAFPWMKMLAKAEKAKKSVTLGTNATSLINGLITSWDDKKRDFKNLVSEIIGDSDDEKASEVFTPGVLDKIVNAIDDAVDEFRALLPDRARHAESIHITSSQLRQLINEELTRDA